MTMTKEFMPEAGSLTVLIVDDDVDMLELCAVKLGIHGYTVLKAIGSVEAHRICTDYPKRIDLILLDVMLYPPSVQLDSSVNAPPRSTEINSGLCCAPNGRSVDSS